MKAIANEPWARQARRAVCGPVVCALTLAGTNCTVPYDAGSNHSHTKLPVDERNPILLLNDSNDDNWQGEYAILLSHGGGSKLVGIVVGTSPNASDIGKNYDAWRGLVAAAQESGFTDTPDPTPSISSPLVRPANGDIDSTQANRSGGALAIIDAATRHSLPYRPLVVATGGRLTDVALAYLVDPAIVDKVVIVSSLGSLRETGAAMGRPNGEMDPWADTIVTSRFRYVQISAYYDQTTDVPAERIPKLPSNALGAWIAAKQPSIWNLPEAADQVAILAVGLPDFAVEVEQVSPVGPVAAGATTGPDLGVDPKAPGWLVRQCDDALAKERFWELLSDDEIFVH